MDKKNLIKFLRKVTPQSLRERLNRHFDELALNAGFVRPQPEEPVDFRGIVDDPKEALARSNGRPVMIDVPVELCRCFGPIAFKMTKDTNHPYSLTAKGFLKGNVTEYDGSPLKSYYYLVQPKNVAELLDISFDNNNVYLKTLDPLGYRFPWQGSPNLIEKCIKLDRYIDEAKGLGYYFNIDDGIHLYGPVSERRGRFELDRIFSLVKSLSKNGFCNSHDDFVTGDVLYNDDNDYVVVIKNGQHRSAVLAAMNYRCISVVISLKNIIYKNQVNEWKGVKEKSFSNEQSLKLFNRIYQGNQPSFMMNIWP